MFNKTSLQNHLFLIYHPVTSLTYDLLYLEHALTAGAVSTPVLVIIAWAA